MNIHSASSMVDAFLCKLERCRNLLLRLQVNFLHPYTPVSPFAVLAQVYIVLPHLKLGQFTSAKETRKFGKAQLKTITCKKTFNPVKLPPPMGSFTCHVLRLPTMLLAGAHIHIVIALF